MTDIQSDLPDGWVWTTLGEVVDILDSRRIPVNSATREKRISGKKQSELFPYYGATGQAGWIDDYIFDDPILLLGEDGAPFLDPFAPKTYVVSRKSWVNNHAHVLKPLPDTIPIPYIRYYLDIFDYRDYVTGTTRLKLNQARMAAIPLPLAPLNEQHRIVDAIESNFTRLDAAEAALRRAQARLAQYKTALLKAACEGRLVPTEAELARQEGRDYEPAQVLLARVLKERRAKWEAEEWARLVARARQRAAAEAGKAEWLDLSEIVYARYLPKDDKWKEKYQEPVAPDLDGLPELPEGWCWSSLGRTYPISVGSTPSRAHPEYWDGDVPWVSSGEVAFCRIRSTRERISELGLKNSSTVVHPIGTVMLGMIGEGRTRGQAAILDIAACHNQNSAAIRVSEVGMPPEYVYYYLYSRYEETRRGSSGNNQLALNRSRVQSIPFPLPPLAEQERIVAEVERRLSLVDALETALAANLTRAARLRQAILRRAFAGQLVPQDANDEPAAVLLERIRDCRGAPLRLPVSRRGS